MLQLPVQRLWPQSLVCGHPAVWGKPWEGPAAREASLRHRCKVWVRASFSCLAILLKKYTWLTSGRDPTCVKMTYQFDPNSTPQRHFIWAAIVQQQWRGAQLQICLLVGWWITGRGPQVRPTFVLKEVWLRRPSGQHSGRGHSCSDWSWNRSFRSLAGCQSPFRLWCVLLLVDSNSVSTRSRFIASLNCELKIFLSYQDVIPYPSAYLSISWLIVITTWIIKNILCIYKIIFLIYLFIYTYIHFMEIWVKKEMSFEIQEVF